MTSTKEKTTRVVEPHEPTVAVGLAPSAISDACLRALRICCEPNDELAVEFRAWLRECVTRELGRREANSADPECVHMEDDAWLLPWHQFNDLDMSEALACSATLLAVDNNPRDLHSALAEIHLTVVAACSARLGELHAAIVDSQRRLSRTEVEP